ncbi:MAG: radical SAM protein [Ruminococcaceae bacterium]|nr:radical SAM protein [Oscillospiraceae bacterium]
MMSAPVVTCTRHRLTVDGDGVTTLVCFHGCPLRCKYCINSFSFNPNTRRMNLSARMLYDRVKIDELYFLATGGGVTFGGGEPLLYATFLKNFRKICGKSWHLCAETSLNVPWKNVETAAGCIDEFIIDCKDTNPEIYRSYTGKDNAQMLENLEKLVRLIGTERIIVRLPLIPEFNTEDDRMKSQQLLEAIGITRFDRFTYLTPEQQALRK